MRLLISAVICTALIGFVTPVQALPAETGTDARMERALQRVSDGTWNNADLEYIKTDPEVAAQVPDPRDKGTSGFRAGRSAAGAGDVPKLSSLGSCGWYYYAWYRKRSLLGFTMYKYYHRVVYCKTSSKITRWQVREDYWTDVDSVAYWRELVRDSQYGIGSGTAHSSRQRHIELCIIKHGCYASLYPRVNLTIRANGDNDYSGSAG